MRRIRTKQQPGRDYARMLKDYFGFHLYGMEVKENGGQMQAQVIYKDYKHIDTVRRELAQMMPEVEFTKLRREFSESAELWALEKLMWEDGTHPAPVIYVQQGDTLVKSTLNDIAIRELRQLELDEDDNIDYAHDDDIIYCCNEKNLRDNAFEG